MKRSEILILLRAFCVVLTAWSAVAAGPAPVPLKRHPGDEFLKKRWTTEEGLPQNTVTSIVQTRDGYLWLGTFGGLVRFDGVKFTVFNTANTPALISNRIMALYEDPDGVLWIGSDTGDIVAYRDGGFELFEISDGQPNNFVSSFLVDRAGTLWVGRRSGLGRYESKRSDRKTFYPMPRGISDIGENAAGELWFATQYGVARRQDDRLIDFPLSADMKTNRTDRLRFDANGNLWTVTRDGFGRFRDGKFQVDFAKTPDPARYLVSLAVDGENRVWFGDYSSLFRLDANGSAEKYDLGDVTSNGIRSMLFDREGNLWIGTNGDGLIRLRRKRVETLSAADGLPSEETNVVVEDPRGGVWIGAYVLSYLNNGTITSYGRQDGLPAERVTALSFDRKGVLWIGTYGGLASLRDGEIKSYVRDDSEKVSVRAIFEDSRGRLWIGRMGGGLQLFQDGVFTTYRKEDGLVDNDVRFLTEDRAGNLWIGTVGGLSRFDGRGFTNYTTAEGLSNNFVRAIIEDDAGTFWIGTYGGGLNRLRDGRLTAITTKNGLFDDFVSRILTDGRDNFWILGNRGIFSVSRRTLDDFADGKIRSVFCSAYGVADGLLVSEGNGGSQPAGWKTGDGRMWFPMIRGLAIIEPEEKNLSAPPVYIEEAQLEREALDLRQPIRIQPGQENLEIHYTGLNFGKPEQIRFRYRLEGLDDEWTDTGIRRVAYFSHLPPGTYRFSVSAANSDAFWSEPATLEITVLAPFWRRGWFIALVILFFFGLIAVSYQLRLNHLERRRALQEELSRRLINAHESERQRIAAELHDGLGQSLLVIKNRSLLGELGAGAGAADSREQFHNISEAATQAIEEVRQITYNLRPVHLNRLGLTQALEAMIETVAATTPIRFDRHIALLDDAFSKDSEVVFYRIIQECVNNIVKHSNAARAEIEILRGARDIVVKIRDDGQGFVPPDERRALTPAKGGFGLVGMAERVRMLGGTHAIESAPGQGTTVTVRIDLQEK
ncbi:MAG: hypothetical protein JSS81_15660 [Acidobacteria bacterium]|nr:hypothetical protein [Acidobacteriota bacterium]